MCFLKSPHVFIIPLLFLGMFFCGCGFWGSQNPEAAQLVEQLSGEYDQRRAASKALVELGEDAVPALIEATSYTSCGMYLASTPKVS